MKSVQITNDYRSNTKHNILSILSFEPAEQVISHGDSALGNNMSGVIEEETLHNAE